MDLMLVTEWLFGILTVCSALLVAFSPKLLHAGFSLLFTFFGVAGLYVLLGADFLAATQVLVYIGGVLVLLLFGILLTTGMGSVDLWSKPVRQKQGFLLGALLMGLLALVVFRTPWALSVPGALEPTAADIGHAFMTTWLLPFEVASILLLGALVGSLHLARQGGKN